MSDKKDKEALQSEEENAPLSDESRGGAASRARNKTVMLSPEMTGEVRAMLQQQEPVRSEPQESMQGQPSAMDSLFSSSDRFETRATSVVDTDSLPRFSAEVDEAVEQGGGFDPMTSLVSGAPPLGGGTVEEERFVDDSYEPEPEQVPAPAVEQPAASGFSVSKPAQPAPAPKVSGSAPRRPVASGPKGWHSVQSAKDERGRLVGLLISYDVMDEGEIFEIRSGRFLITSRPTDNGDYLLIDDESVSPLHAIVRATEGGKIQVLDQLSEYGTGLTKVDEEGEEEVAGGLATVGHGDTVRFGKRYFVVVTIPEVAKKDA